MPIHFEDRDIASETVGVRSALIVPCYLCPAVTVATRENRPFMRFLRNPVKSAPFDEYLEALRSRLGERGVSTEVFRSRLYHHWFMCMWTARRRKKLAKQAEKHDAVIVLGCDSATQTIRDAVPAGVRVIEGMKTTGIMNGRLRFRLPDSLVFDGCKVVPISPQKTT
jgi:hypothetical protein